MAAKVFISYRRDDSKYPAGMIYAAFCKVLPSEHVFMDVNSIPPGANFRKILGDWVAKCDVLLALIGSGWINATDPKTGSRRLDNPSDFVRIEIGEALARDIPVVPVPLDSAPMPDIHFLSDDLRELVDRQAEFVEYRTFDADVDRLIKKLGLTQQTGQPRGTTVADALKKWHDAAHTAFLNDASAQDTRPNLARWHWQVSYIIERGDGQLLKHENLIEILRQVHAEVSRYGGYKLEYD
jgi:hypothetical protein